MIADHPDDLVNDACFLRLREFVPEVETFLKIEGLNPAGSIKLKPARAMVDAAEENGDLRVGGRFIESSSGSFAVALAMIAASRGYTFISVVDPNISPLTREMIRALGGSIVPVQERDEHGGYLSSRIAEVRRRVEADPELIWLNQYANPQNPAAHFRGTARSISQEFGGVDAVVIGAGTTGTLMGCSEYFRQHSPDTLLVAVDTIGSVTFGGPPGIRYLPGLGSSREPELFGPTAADVHVLVDESSSIRMCRFIARRYGLLCGGSTGSILAATRYLAGVFPSGSRVVALAPDLGERYLGTVYDDDWVREHYGTIPEGIDDLDVTIVDASAVARPERESVTL